MLSSTVESFHTRWPLTQVLTHVDAGFDQHPGDLLTAFLMNQSADVGGIYLGTTAGVMEVLGHRVVTTGAQWLAA